MKVFGVRLRKVVSISETVLSGWSELYLKISEICVVVRIWVVGVRDCPNCQNR